MTAEPAAAAAPVISDQEIRDWAKSTGRTVGERGAVSPKLRAEYLARAGQIGAGIEAPDPPSRPPAALSGPERPAKPPRPARAERTPQPVRPAASGWQGRVGAWFKGTGQQPAAAAKGKGRQPKAPAEPRADRPRMPLVKLVGTGWANLARLTEHINVPVARAMAWQSPYVGVVADDVISGTPLDRPLQFAARMQESASGIGAMIAMPLIVGAMTSERNDPEVHGMAAAARLQLLDAALDQALDAQLEMFGRNPELIAKIQRNAAEMAERRAEIDSIKGMFFSDIPEPVEVREGDTPERIAEAQAQAQANAEAEQQLREAVAAVKFMRPPTGPDTRGQAAEAAAASMAASAERAAAAEAESLAGARGMVRD